MKKNILNIANWLLTGYFVALINIVLFNHSKYTFVETLLLSSLLSFIFILVGYLVSKLIND